MDSEAHKGDQSESQMCIKGCRFFGSSSTENMCSKCYKDHLLKYKAEAIADAAKVAAAPTNSTKDMDEQTAMILIQEAWTRICEAWEADCPHPTQKD